MNIFVLDQDPTLSAQMYCDKHVPKMVVELLQQLGSAVIRHGAKPEQMPPTKKGTPLKGGYHHHPCTRWVGESRANFVWSCLHAQELCREYTRRFDKQHFCEHGIRHLSNMVAMIPEGDLTPFALAMPDEFRPLELGLNYTGMEGGMEIKYSSHASGDEAVQAYRSYYHSKQFAEWNKSRDAPSWWMGVQ